MVCNSYGLAQHIHIFSIISATGKAYFAPNTLSAEFYQSWEKAQVSDLSMKVVCIKASFFSGWEEIRRMGTSVQAIFTRSDSVLRGTLAQQSGLIELVVQVCGKVNHRCLWSAGETGSRGGAN